MREIKTSMLNLSDPDMVMECYTLEQFNIYETNVMNFNNCNGIFDREFVPGEI